MVQAFLLKLLWRYRQHMLPEAQYDAQLAAAAAAQQAQQPSRRPSLGRLSAGSGSGLVHSRGSSSGRELRGGGSGSHPPPDDCVRAHGYVFDWPAFLAASGGRGRGKAGAFLRAFRHSQVGRNLGRTPLQLEF